MTSDHDLTRLTPELRAALEGAQLSTASRTALLDTTREPGPCQLWRVRWAETSLLALVTEVRGDGIRAVPVTLEPGFVTDTSFLADESETSLETSVVIWEQLSTLLPFRVFDRQLGGLGSETLEEMKTSTIPISRRGLSIKDVMDPRAELVALLQDSLDNLSAAHWAPSGSGTLPDRFEDYQIDPSRLRDLLNVKPQEVLKLMRGSGAVTTLHAKLLADATASEPEEWLEANPELPGEVVEALDAPTHRGLLRLLSVERGMDEPSTWRVTGRDLFALAARQTGEAAPSWGQRLERYLRGVLNG